MQKLKELEDQLLATETKTYHVSLDFYSVGAKSAE